MENELQQIIVDFQNIFQLKASVSGNQILLYLQGGIENLKKQLIEQDKYNDYREFKNFYLSFIYDYSRAFR